MVLEDFPLLASVLTGRSREKTIEALRLLKVGLGGGEIPNVRFEDTVKYYLSDALNSVVKATVQNRVRWNHELRTYTFDGVAFTAVDEKVEKVLGSSPYPHMVPGKLAKIEKIQGTSPYLTAAQAVLSEFAPIAEAMKTVKDEGRVVKRQPKPPEDLKAKYHAPAASQRAIAKVRDILIKVTQDAYDDLLARLILRHSNDLDAYIDLAGQLRDLLPTGKRPERGSDLWTTVENLRLMRGNTLHSHRLSEAVEKIEDEVNDPYTGYFFRRERRAENAEAIIREVAIRDADEIRDAFVYKNLEKLDSILEGRGDFLSIEIVGHRIAMSGLEGTFLLRFKDGASFTIKNSVVEVVNSYGTEFLRWPLTFHDVKFGNGTAMKGPSEEKMNTEFVGRSAACHPLA